MGVLMRRMLSAFVGAIGILSILASGGGGGGDDPVDNTVTQADIAQAKALTGEFRSTATTFQDVEDPTNAFAATVENAGAVSGKCSAAALDALSVATENALGIYEDQSIPGTYQFQTVDGQGGNPQTADVSLSSSSGNDQIAMVNEPVYGSDDEGGTTLNTVDLTITLPVNSDTSTATPLNAAVTAEVACPEVGADAGITVTLNGTLTIVRRPAAPSGEPTIDHIGSLVFDGDATIAQTQSPTVTNPVSIEGSLTLQVSSCTVDDCTNQSILISGTLSDLTESTTVELGLSKTATQGIVSIGFNAILDGDTREVVITFEANISDPENPTPTEITIDVTGPDGGITITLDQFNVDGEPTRVSISDGVGGTMTITNLNSAGPVFGNVVVNGKTVGTLEENGSGDLIIRYVDGTFETLAGA